VLTPFVAGQKVPAATLVAAFDATLYSKYQTADQTVNNTTTLVSSNDLVVPVVQSGIYIFNSLIMTNSGTTPDFNLNINAPLNSTITATRFGGTTGAPTSLDMSVLTGTTNLAISLGGNAATIAAQPAGIIIISTTPGNVTFQFAQVTATASNTTLKLGSWIQFAQVG
jgi:uncharacterized membrane protein